MKHSWSDSWPGIYLYHALDDGLQNDLQVSVVTFTSLQEHTCETLQKSSKCIFMEYTFFRNHNVYKYIGKNSFKCDHKASTTLRWKV